MDYLARLIVALLLFASLPALSAVVIEHNTWDNVMRWRDSNGVLQGIRFPPDPTFAAGAGTDVAVSRAVTADLAGAAEAVVTEAGTITAVDVAKGAIGLMRGGLAGAAISIALPVVLEAAKLAWNGSSFTQQSAAGDPDDGIYPVPDFAESVDYGGGYGGGCGSPIGALTLSMNSNGTTLSVHTIQGSPAPSGWSNFSCGGGKYHWSRSYTGTCPFGDFFYFSSATCSITGPTVVVDDDTAANDMAGNMGTNGPPIAQGVYDNGGTMQSSDPTASGPSVVSGPTTTSSSTSDAGTTTTTTHTDYGMGYQGDTVTVTPTTTTTTTTPDGKQTTTTQTTQPGDSGGDAPPADSQQQKVMCDKYPNASGCDELGTPTDVDLPTQTVNVALSPTLSAAGSCPAPISIPVLGKTYSLSWQPVCDFATGVRPIVLALSWLGAGLFIFMVARG